MTTRPPQRVRPELVRFYVTAVEKARIAKAAEGRKATLSRWARETLLRAAREQLRGEWPG